MKKIKGVIGKIPKEIYLILFLAVMLMIPVLEYQVSYGDDFMFHATNMFGNMTSTSIPTFHLIPCKILGGEIANGFGYGSGIFYPPLSFFVSGYIAKFLCILKIDRNYAINLTQFLALIVSGINMFILMYKLTKGNKKVSSISAISYMSSPYFLADIYQRCAMGEIFIFVFIPLVFLGLYNLFFEDNYKNFYICFIIGYVGCIFSHLVLTIFLTIFILILMIINIKKIFKKKYIFKLCLASIIIVLITAPYTFPMLEHKILGNYVVFAKDSMYSKESIKAYALHIGDLFSLYDRNKDGVCVYLNAISFALLIITIVYHKKIFKTTRDKKIYIITCILLGLSVFSCSRFLLWQKLPSFLKAIQFPWRLVTFVTFAISILAGYAINIFSNKEGKLAYIVFITMLVIFGFQSIDYHRIGSAKLKHELHIGWQQEYLPVKTRHYLKYYKNRDRNIKTLSGKIKTKIKINKSPYLLANVDVKTSKAKVELPRIYYLGYKITLKDKKGKIYNLKYREGKYGFIETTIPRSGTLEIKYKGTLIYKVSLILSFIGFLSFICVVGRNKLKKNK